VRRLVAIRPKRRRKRSEWLSKWREFSNTDSPTPRPKSPSNAELGAIDSAVDWSLVNSTVPVRIPGSNYL